MALRKRIGVMVPSTNTTFEADFQLVQNYVYPWATFGKEPMATWLKAGEHELINHFPEEEINVVVVGGETNGYWRIMGAKYRKTVSVDEWR